MALFLGVDVHQGKGHQRVVGDDAIAANAMVPFGGRQIHLVPARIERGDAAVAGADIGGRELFDRSAECIAKSDAVQHGADAAADW